MSVTSILRRMTFKTEASELGQKYKIFTILLYSVDFTLDGVTWRKRHSMHMAQPCGQGGQHDCRGLGNCGSLLIHLPHKRPPWLSRPKYSSQFTIFTYVHRDTLTALITSNGHQEVLTIFSHGLCSWHFIYKFGANES